MGLRLWRLARPSSLTCPQAGLSRPTAARPYPPTNERKQCALGALEESLALFPDAAPVLLRALRAPERRGLASALAAPAQRPGCAAAASAGAAAAAPRGAPPEAAGAAAHGADVPGVGAPGVGADGWGPADMAAGPAAQPPAGTHGGGPRSPRRAPPASAAAAGDEAAAAPSLGGGLEDVGAQDVLLLWVMQRCCPAQADNACGALAEAILESRFAGVRC